MDAINEIFEVVSNIISSAIIISFFIIIVKIIKAISNASKRNNVDRPANRTVIKHVYRNVDGHVQKEIPIMKYIQQSNQEPQQEENLFTEYRKSKMRGKSISSEMSSLENRGNDWLAKQLKEERDVLRRGDFLDLGAMHDKACAADRLRDRHRDNCEDKYVDDGTK